MISKSFHVANLIKRKRKELNLSQDDLAKSLNFGSRGFQVISNIERGIQQIPVKYAAKLAEKLQVSNEMIIFELCQDYKMNVDREVSGKLQNSSHIGEV
jgi:transcriptional regulator with XRE-family HTH domain